MTGELMKRTLLVVLASAFSGALMAQPAAQPPKTFTSASEITAMMAKAKSDRKQDQANYIQRILGLTPYTANLEYRAAVGPAAVHVKEAELFYVIDGSGTLVTGGKLTDITNPGNADNPQGKGIEGGTSRPVAKGDFFIVPENTPHWFSKIDGTLVLMSLHVPRVNGQ
jgi:mannose-6-phosphate isomerase-like protein (cupin superfamily)